MLLPGMKMRYLSVLFLIIFLTGCRSPVNTPPLAPSPEASSPTQVEAETSKAGVSITASPTTVSPGQTITVTFSGAPGNLKDFIALYKVGTPNGPGYLAYKFLNGQKSGTLTFTAPSTGGTYEFRMFQNNTWTYLGKSNTVTVVQQKLIFDGTGSPYICGTNCSGSSYFDGLNEISIVSGRVNKVVRIYPVNGSLNGSEYVVVQGCRWNPDSRSFNSSPEEICSSNSSSNGYVVTISNNQIIISLSENKDLSFRAVPWNNVKVIVKASQNGPELGSYIFKWNQGTQSIGGIFPRVESAYGQCVWWAIKRFWETKRKEIWPPFYPSEGRKSYSTIYAKLYTPLPGDVLIRDSDNGTLKHYAFIERTENYYRYDGTLYIKIYITQYNYPLTQLPSSETLYWRPDRETKLFTKNTTGDPIAPSIYQFDYYIR